jgi:hypothetical protein
MRSRASVIVGVPSGNPVRNAVSAGTGPSVSSSTFELGISPRSRMSSEKPESRDSALWMRPTTTVPAPGRVATSPICARSLRHCLRVERETLSPTANSRSAGSASPAPSSPSSSTEASALRSRPASGPCWRPMRSLTAA